MYNNWYLLFFLDDCLLSWLDWTTDSYRKGIISTNCCIQDNSRLKRIISTNFCIQDNSHLKRIISTNCTYTVGAPDDGSRWTRNM